LNGYVNTVIANAAIVPAGTSGAIDVYASQNTELIIDINGYYSQASGMTLAQGSAGSPSISFTGDPGTGVFSSGANTLNITTGGTNRLTVRPDGDLDLTGNIRKNGTLFLHNVGCGGAPGCGSTGIGLGALAVNNQIGNTATGYGALGFNTDGFYNTANGYLALNHNIPIGSNNTALGSQALYTNTTGIQNTATGADALISNTTASYNTANGYQALYSNRGPSADNNTAIGFQALYSNNNDLNTAVGSGALRSNTAGYLNTAIGYSAGFQTENGARNTFVGSSTGNVQGFDPSFSTAIGHNAKVGCSHCIVLGDPADDSLTVGIGTSFPLQAKLDVESPANGVGVYGYSNGANSISVYGNAGVAKGSIAVRAEGTSFFSGDSTPLTAGVAPGNGVVIGSINPTLSTSVGYIFSLDYRGGGGPRTLLLNHPGGTVGIGGGGLIPDQTLTVFGNASKSAGGNTWAAYSDERLKDIKGDFNSGLEAVMQLQPIRYEYKEDNPLGIKSNGEQIGFSAQAVQKVIPEAVMQNDKGYLLINGDPILWTMLNAIKEQQKEIEELKKEIQEMRAK
jgi:hypothetical protein